jgi:putative OmpL-like beta-barrel porin-2
VRKSVPAGRPPRCSGRRTAFSPRRILDGAALLLGLAAVVAPGVSVPRANAQISLANLLGRENAPAGQPPRLIDEIILFGYVENSWVFNLGRPGRHDVNELRFYDHDAGYTFNAAELSLKKEPSARYRLGYGAVFTAGLDSQKNHSLGIFRDSDDSAPLYRNTPQCDLVEAYASYLVPLGHGLTLKAGKWATLTGYEVYESPKNLNFSRSFLYTIGTPYTHTGLIATYQFTKWFSLTAGFTNGWDSADNNNGHLRPVGSFVFTPVDQLTATVDYLFGPEQDRNQMRRGTVNQRWLVDTVIVYTGIDQVTLAANFDLAGEENDPALVALGPRQHHDSRWGGIAGYAGYDWTKALRTVLRLEYFADPQGVRSSETIRPGRNVDLWEITATAEYKIWRGVVGRLEVRHDQANRRAFSVEDHRGPTSRGQTTLTLALYYIFL